MFSALVKKWSSQSPLCLQVSCQSRGLLAQVRQGDKLLPPGQWFQVSGPWQPEERQRALRWRSLQEQGLETTSEGLLWPHAALLSLDASELRPLCGCPAFPYLPRLQASQNLSHAELAYHLTFLDSSGRQVPLQLYPALAQMGADFWVLPAALRELGAQLQADRPDPGAGRHAELQKLKSWLTQLGGDCDDYLRRQDIHGLEQVQFDLEDDGQELCLTPHCEQLPTGMDLVRLTSEFSRVQADYRTLGSDGQMVRILPSPSVREALEQWRRLGRLRGARRQEFLRQPRAFLTQSAIDWTDLEQQLAFLRPSELSSAPPKEVLHLSEEPHPPTMEPPRLSLGPPQFNDLGGTVRLPLGPPQFNDLGGTVRLPLGPPQFEEVPEWVEPSQEPLPAGEPVLEVATPAPKTSAQLPASLKAGVELLPHQLQGLAWLQGLVERDQPGALLADDMGLGKTLQVLTFLEWLRARHQGTSLVIVPLILLQTWKREYLQFFQGPGALQSQEIVILYREGLKPYGSAGGGLNLEGLTQVPLLITSLEVVRSHQVDLERVDWTAVVIDEAQAIKNPRSQISRAVHSLRARFRLAATGTPVENHLGDLWSLLEFAHPGYLGSYRQFLSNYRCDGLEELERVSQELQSKIDPLYLRRTKQDMLPDLPRKSLHCIPLKMPPSQARAYAQALESLQSSGKRGLEATWILRKISCWDGNGDCNLAELSARSAKLTWLLELLPSLRAAGEKVLIFVEIVEIQELLLLVLESQLKIRVEIINGQTSSGPSQAGREAILQRFRQQPGFAVLILSPKAAGLGLTLLEANHVIHFSRLWNPAREDQATDRVYRIGQKKEVHVYYPLAEHPELASFDMYLSQVLERKRQLAESALFPALLGEVQSEDLEGFFQGNSRATIQEAPAWLRILRQPNRFSQLEDFLAALEPTGLSLYGLLPKVARVRNFTGSTLARLSQRPSRELFMSPLPAEAEAATVLDPQGHWVLYLARGLSPQRELAYLAHCLLHRALGHLTRRDQRGHWDRWSDLQQPERRWDAEVQRWLEGEVPHAN